MSGVLSSETWHQEVAFGNIRLDFLAFAAQVLPFTLDSNSPLSLVIEAKGPKENLDRHVRRLRQYLISLHTKYGLLTNGKDLRIYERFGDDIRIIFQCHGEEISDRIFEMRSLVGRNSLKGKHNSRLTALKKRKLASQKSIKKLTSEREKIVKIIAIYHNKGGVGKTTVSVNLAAALRKKGHNVLLIDLDSQANTTFAAGLIKFQFEEDDDLKDKNVYHLLESGELNLISDIARKSNYFNNPEIDIIPSHISLIEKQFRLNAIDSSKTRMITKLKQVKDEYDFVIIDTPPSRDLYARVAIIAANYLLIPSDLRPFANQGLSSVKKFINEIDEFREIIGKPPINIMGVLPSKISTNKRFLEYTFPRQRSTITEHYEFPVMNSIIFERAALSHCINQTIEVGGIEIPDPKSIFEYAEETISAHQSADEFETLANEVLEKMGEQK
ncbi:MAG: AAA family ATPase [Cyanothece sp. SIO1E1]|nr:AAA family ATPase [Cyanothece sp. SIO1E1]